MKLIKGTNLSADLRADVLRQFVHRWTIQNYSPQLARLLYASYPWNPKPQKTDDQWLADHAFYVTKENRLALNRKYCEPEYMAKEESQ